MLSQYWRKLSFINSNRISDKPERIRYILTNQIILTSILLTTAFCLTSILFHDTSLVGICLSIIGFSALCYYMSVKFHPCLARHMLTAGVIFLIYKISVTLGKEIGVQLLLFPVMAFTFLLFDPKKYWNIIVVIITSISLLLLIQEQPALASNHNKIADENSYMIFFILTGVLTIYALTHFFKNNISNWNHHHQTHSRLQSIIESTPDVIVLLDRHWRITGANSRFKEWFEKSLNSNNE